MYVGRALLRNEPEADLAVKNMATTSSVDDQYLRELAAWGGPVRIRCGGDHLIEDAVVKAVGTYAILVEMPDGENEELIFKHAIDSIGRIREE
jgi:sRNA-binding regulator protein Hfq